MSTFLMFGDYHQETANDICAERTDEAVKVLRKCGGEVKEMCALLGSEHDLMFMVDMPTIENAMEASMKLRRETGIEFHTCPTVDIRKFDKICAA